MIVPLSEAFRPRVMQYVVDEWAGPMIVTRGAVHDASKAEGFISVTDGDVSGYVLIAMPCMEWESTRLRHRPVSYPPCPDIFSPDYTPSYPAA